MAANSSRSADRGVADGEGFGNSINQVAQGLAGLQEAVRRQTQESLRRQELKMQETIRHQLQETVPQQERKLQEALRLQMQEAVQQQERRMKEVLHEYMLEILRQQDKMMLETLREEMQENLAQQDQIVLEALRQQMLEAMTQQEQKMKELVHLQTQEALLQQGQKIQDILRQQMQHALRHDDRTIAEQLTEETQQEARMLEKMQDIARRSDAKIAWAEEAIGTLTQRLEEGLHRVEERLGVVESQAPAERDRPEGQDPYRLLENRMIKLEDSVQRALQSVFPRVEALVAQLGQQRQSPPLFPSSPPPLPSSAPPPLPATPPPIVSSASLVLLPPTHRPRSFAGPPVFSPPAPPPRVIPERRAALRGELCRAVVDGRVDEVRRVLDGGASVNFLDANGWTPLTLAALNADVVVVALLLERGADVAARSTRGHTALHFAASRDREGACVDMLLAAGAPVDARDAEGWTPLHHAAKWNNEAAVRGLLGAGANVTLRDEQGRSAYDIAPANALRLLFQT